MAVQPQSGSGESVVNDPDMFYCWGSFGSLDGDLDGLPGLVSAGVAWRNPSKEDGFTIHVPDFDPLMVDSGGFQAANYFGSTYPYAPKEYHDWCEEIGADIAAGMDVACERSEKLYDASEDWETKTFPGPWQRRQKTALWNQVRQMEVYENGDYSHEFMPVIQGLHPASYEFFIDMMIEQGLAEYDKLRVGTVCKRSDRDEILEIIEVVRDYFPDKYIHLFGATLNTWKDSQFIGKFDSSDTAAWHWGSESKAHQKEMLAEYQQKVANSIVASGQKTLI